VAADGKGLGIVAGDLDNDGAIEVFIANDSVANHFFDPVNASIFTRFEEKALGAGLAYDANGVAQACMGVAAGDTNRDGLIDFGVTNFFEESNNLFVQASPGFFTDQAARRGISAPSRKLLGFGAQFLDADLDGWLDLVVTNGDVDDFSAAGRPYHMPPQFFANRGGHFEMKRPEQAGPYFAKSYLGRGLATLDWNRDGRVDFAVSNLEAPACLVTNGTSTENHFLALSLVGAISNRDAIGARVSVIENGLESAVGWICAGDGYQASNERRVVFGLGAHMAPVDVRVRWPSGHDQRFDALAIDREHLLVEMRSALPN
jgi:hypothetical protein